MLFWHLNYEMKRHKKVNIRQSAAVRKRAARCARAGETIEIKRAERILLPHQKVKYGIAVSRL